MCERSRPRRWLAASIARPAPFSGRVETIRFHRGEYEVAGMKASRYNIVSVAARYAEALARLKNIGDCAVVERGGIQRQLVLQCPDGCGDILSINLDPRSGPAWRLYNRRGEWSLFPSIDRPTGCLSHFILWRHRILWCDGGEGDAPAMHADLGEHVLATLASGAPIDFVEIADALDEVPWDVLSVCRHLVKRGLLEEQEGERRGVFASRSTGS